MDRLSAERKRQENISVLPGFHSNAYLLHMRAIPGHSGGNKVDPSLQDNVEFRTIGLITSIRLVLLMTAIPSSDQV